METNVLVNLVGSLGFPIVAFLLVYVDLKKLIIKNTEAINNLVLLVTKKLK